MDDHGTSFYSEESGFGSGDDASQDIFSSSPSGGEESRFSSFLSESPSPSPTPPPPTSLIESQYKELLAKYLRYATGELRINDPFSDIDFGELCEVSVLNGMKAADLKESVQLLGLMISVYGKQVDILESQVKAQAGAIVANKYRRCRIPKETEPPGQDETGSSDMLEESFASTSSSIINPARMRNSLASNNASITIDFSEVAPDIIQRKMRIQKEFNQLASDLLHCDLFTAADYEQGRNLEEMDLPLDDAVAVPLMFQRLFRRTEYNGGPQTMGELSFMSVNIDEEVESSSVDPNPGAELTELVNVDNQDPSELSVPTPANLETEGLSFVSDGPPQLEYQGPCIINNVDPAIQDEIFCDENALPPLLVCQVTAKEKRRIFQENQENLGENADENVGRKKRINPDKQRGPLEPLNISAEDFGLLPPEAKRARLDGTVEDQENMMDITEPVPHIEVMPELHPEMPSDLPTMICSSDSYAEDLQTANISQGTPEPALSSTYFGTPSPLFKGKDSPSFARPFNDIDAVISELEGIVLSELQNKEDLSFVDLLLKSNLNVRAEDGTLIKSPAEQYKLTVSPHIAFCAVLHLCHKNGLHLLNVDSDLCKITKRSPQLIMPESFDKLKNPFYHQRED